VLGIATSPGGFPRSFLGLRVCRLPSACGGRCCSETQTTVAPYRVTGLDDTSCRSKPSCGDSRKTAVQPAFFSSRGFCFSSPSQIFSIFESPNSISGSQEKNTMADLDPEKGAAPAEHEPPTTDPRGSLGDESIGKRRQLPGFVRKALTVGLVEERGIRPVPLEERTSRRYFNVFTIWMSMNTNILPFVCHSFSFTLSLALFFTLDR